MATRRRADRYQDGDGTPCDITEVVKCILNHFDYISVERIHNLCFLSDYRYFSENEKKLTNAEYKAFLDGCISEDVKEAIAILDGIQEKSVRIGGESVDTIKVENVFKCDLTATEARTVREVTRKYGDNAPNEVAEEIRSIPFYQDTQIGDTIKFKLTV